MSFKRNALVISCVSSVFALAALGLAQTLQPRSSNWAATRAEQRSRRNLAATRIREYVQRCSSQESVLFEFISRYPLTHEVETESGGNADVKINFNSTKIFNIQKLLQQRITMLEEQKATALDELMRGLRCSKCHHTKSEIERTPLPNGSLETFEQHIGRVQGVIVKASDAEIAAKAREYDEQIASKKHELSQIANALEAWGREIGQIEVEISNWNDAHFGEAGAIQREWVSERDSLSREIGLANSTLYVAKQALDKAKPSDKPDLALRKAVVTQAEQRMSSAVEAYRMAFSDISDQGVRFNREMAAERQQLRQCINGLTYDTVTTFRLANALRASYVTVDSINLPSRSTQDW
jgi:hypothetical protein